MSKINGKKTHAHTQRTYCRAKYYILILYCVRILLSVIYAVVTYCTTTWTRYQNQYGIVHRHIQPRGSGPGVQPDERVVCIPRRKRQPQRRPVHRGRPAHTQRMVVQLPEVHPRTVRPTERSPRAQNSDAKSRGTRDNAVRLRHVEPARVPLRHAAPSLPQVLDSLHRLAKAQSRRPPDFLLSGHASQDGK